MNKLERFTHSLKKQISPDSKTHLSQKVIQKVMTLSPLGGLVPQLTKEGTIFTPDEWNVARAALTVFAVGTLLGTEASRRRTMEAAHKQDRNLSKASMVFRTLGVGAVLYVIWTIDRI